MVQEVTRVILAHMREQFELCERGRSYPLHDHDKGRLQVFDLATGQLKRAFTTSEWLLVDCGCDADGGHCNSVVTHQWVRALY